jgi:hypothetical protein
LGCWELGLSRCLFMKGDWVNGSKTHEHWESWSITFPLMNHLCCTSGFNRWFTIFLLWILSAFDFNIMTTNSKFWPCDIEFVILPLWHIKWFLFLFVLPWSFVAFEKYFHTLKHKMKHYKSNCKKKKIQMKRNNGNLN